MYYPTIGDRVRLSGRRNEYVVVSADYTTGLAAIRLQTDGGSIEESASLGLFFESTSFDCAQDGARAHTDRIASGKQMLRSSRALIDCQRALIADWQDTIFATSEVIRISQRLIYRSDLVIARARTLD